MPVWACTRPEATASASAAWSRSVGGIQIRVDLSTAAIFALIAFGLAAWQFPAVNPYQATLTYAQSFPVTRDVTDTVCGLVTLDRIKHVPAGSS